LLLFGFADTHCTRYILLQITSGIGKTRSREMRNEEMGGNGKWCTRKWEHTLVLIEERWLSQLELGSEEVVTALLEYF